MDRNDIIRMARKAGIAHHGLGWTCWEGQLENFAELVVAAERERIKAANAPEIEAVNAHIKALEDAVAAEREQFAAECIDLVAMYGGSVDLEAAIRARGNHANG